MYFWNKSLHVSGSSSVHRQEFSTVHTAIVYVIQILLTACEQDQDGTALPSWFCSQAVSNPVWRMPLLCVQWETPDDGQKNCPKHVEFCSKNKFEKLVHLAGFIIRNYFESWLIFSRYRLKIKDVPCKTQINAVNYLFYYPFSKDTRNLINNSKVQKMLEMSSAFLKIQFPLLIRFFFLFLISKSNLGNAYCSLFSVMLQDFHATWLIAVNCWFNKSTQNNIRAQDLLFLVA